MSMDLTHRRDRDGGREQAVGDRESSAEQAQDEERPLDPRAREDAQSLQRRRDAREILDLDVVARAPAEDGQARHVAAVEDGARLVVRWRGRVQAGEQAEAAALALGRAKVERDLRVDDQREAAADPSSVRWRI